MACTRCITELALPPGTRVEVDGIVGTIGEAGKVLPGSVRKAASGNGAMGGTLASLAAERTSTGSLPTGTSSRTLT